MLIYKGIRLNIRVDDVDVPEYSVGQDVARTRVTCWVPSQIGRELVITTINERQERCTIMVKVDGKIADEFLLNSSETRNATFCRPSPSIEEPFVFAKLDLMDDGILLNTSGEIELVCRSPFCVEALKIPNSNNQKISEIKAPNERTERSVGKHVGFKYTERIDHIVTFVLRYQPLESLRAWGIMPSTLRQGATTSLINTTLEKGGPQREATGLKRKVSALCELITTDSKSTAELLGSGHKRPKTCLKDGDPATLRSSSAMFCGNTGGIPEKAGDIEAAKTGTQLNMEMDEECAQPAGGDHKHPSNVASGWSLCTDDDKRPVFHMASDPYPKAWREDLRARIAEIQKKWPNAILAAHSICRKNPDMINQIMDGILDLTGVKVDPDDVDTLDDTTPWIIVNAKNEVAASKMVTTGLIFSSQYGFTVTFRRMYTTPAGVRNWFVKVTIKKESTQLHGITQLPSITDIKAQLHQTWEEVEEIYIAPLGNSNGNHFFAKTFFSEELENPFSATRSIRKIDSHFKYEVRRASCRICYSHAHLATNCFWRLTEVEGNGT